MIKKFNQYNENSSSQANICKCIKTIKFKKGLNYFQDFTYNCYIKPNNSVSVSFEDGKFTTMSKDTFDKHFEFDNSSSKGGSDFNDEQLKMGIKIEKEHLDVYQRLENYLDSFNVGMPFTEDEFAESIAKAHLKEMPDYYDRLIEMEKK